MFQDLRFGLRMLLKNRGFAVIAVLTLGLGIGANTSVFSVAYATLLRPLPFREQERLVVAWKSDETTKHPFVEISIPEFNDWRNQNRVFEHLAAMTTSIYGFSYTLTGRGEPERIHSARVSADFFPALGVAPLLGRAFTADEDSPGAARVAVISHGLWQRRFNADPNLVGQMITLNDGGNQSALEAAVKPGQTIKLNDIGFTIVGVMPPDFEFLKGVDMWVPLSATSGKDVVESRIGFLQAVGRLKPSVTLEQAKAELDAIIGRIAAQHPEMRASGERAVVKPLTSYIFGDARPALYLLLAATALLLLIACANIANLQLARATSRRREIALRTAFGAGRGRLARQLMIESLALAIAGGGLGVLLAYWLIGPLTRLAPADIPRIEAVEINLPALLFTCGLTLMAAFVCGLAPALIASNASGVNIIESLNAGGGKVGGERRGKRLRGALVVAQIAITLALIIGAGLISRSLLNLRQIDPGFDQRNVLSFQVQLHGGKYPDVEKTRDFFQQLLERIEAQPGVAAAGAVLMRPLEAPVGWYVRYATDGQSVDEMMRNAILNCVSITPRYLRAIGIPLKAGRDFTEQDGGGAPQVVIIGETMARAAFAPGVDPIGKRVNIGGQGWRTIVGIAGDARLIDLKDARWNVYVPYRQFSHPVSYVAIRAASDPAALMAMVRREVAALDPEQAVMSVMTMEQRVNASLARPRFNALLLNLLSALAAMLAAVGIYGVISYSVTQRTREIGIRLALGAQRRNVLRLVIGQGMALAVAGVAIGLAASLALTQLMKGLLYGVSATDLLTFAGAALLLGAVAIAACWLPARRAMKVDPMVALREE